MATLSPFRYIQLCRYILTRVLSDKHLAPAMSIWKGKARQVPSASSPQPSISRSSIRTLGFATAMERQSGDDGPIAGPSRKPLPPSYRSPRGPLRPDPNLPPEPNEIYRLMNDERLFVGDVQPPKEVVVLCHGE
jgi:triacylglycerol lipase